ncbi:MAG: RcnB family protein [Gallionella sp.]|jgi:Ni/Co efflux regulator RcnB|nr:RcnB family protein [Gallionella sp.]MCK9355000.1 RcnB family protein [Gallionella sp.]
MQRIRTIHTLIFALAAMLASGTALADKPSWAGGDKSGKQEQKQENRQQHGDAPRDASGMSISLHFGEQQRTVVQDYFAGQFRAGRCPPGLAKKRNGCMPPGQAKKWAMGKPLPRDAIFHDLPPRLVVQLGAPPAGHRYVRVAADILLIAVGTAMVVDAIEDIGKM